MKNRFDHKIYHAAWSLLAYAFFAAILLLPGRNIIGSIYYLIGSAGMFFSMLWIMKKWHGKNMLIAVLFLALIVRLFTIIQFPTNSDINRYVWEGEIQVAGYNPFIFSPESSKLEHLRNQNWKDINHKSMPAIYLPFAQMLFKAGAAISPTHHFFKIMLVFFDVGTIFLLLLMIRATSLDCREIVLYALNPLTIIYIAGEGHLESILVFWIVLSLYGWKQKKYWLMYLAIGFALMTKPTPIIFLPLLLEYKNLKYSPFLILPMTLMLPYWDAEASFLSSFGLFISNYYYNGFFIYIVESITGSLPASWVAMLIAASLCGFVFFLTPDRTRSVFLVSAILLVFTPTFHPWYLLLITPFLVFYTSIPWLILHLTVLPLIFSFHPASWVNYAFWHNKYLLQSIEYLPFIAAGLWCFGRYHHNRLVSFPEAASVSIIIPVRNDEKTIGNCINSIRKNAKFSEIIVVDGGSTDRTLEILNQFSEVKLLSSASDRASQIETGLSHAKNDVAVLIGADTRLLPGAISQMILELNLNPGAAGGFFGTVRNNPGFKYHFKEKLEKLRILVAGISFGSQALFFRRKAFGVNFAETKLMEDLELSLRIKENGDCLFIPDGIEGSGKKTKWNFSIFLKFTFSAIIYLTKRRLGMLNESKNISTRPFNRNSIPLSSLLRLVRFRGHNFNKKSS